MRSPDPHRFLVVYFLLGHSDPWVWVGRKRCQLFYGDSPVHYLLWVIQAVHLRFSMFVLPLINRISLLNCAQRNEFTSFGDLLPVRGDWSANPTSSVLGSFWGTAESSGYYSTVGFHLLMAGSVAHKNVGRISYFGDKGVCYIGLEKWSSVALLTYDLQVIPSHRFFGCLPANTVSSTASSPDCSYGRCSGVQFATPAYGALHYGLYGPLYLHSLRPV